MKYAIIVSRKDEAGMNIASNLLKHHEFEEKDSSWVNGNISLYYANEDSIYCEGIDKTIDADIIIFATKHQSAAGVNSLSTHVPGNWGKAEVGGEEGKLCVAPASLLKEMFIELNRRAADFTGDVTLEATHHGPLIDKPCMFIEIGSCLEHWKTPEYGKIIADTIMAVLQRERKEYPAVVALGGQHYPSQLNKVLLKTEYAISHICPKYALPYLDEDMINQAIEKTLEKVDFILLDWKGLGIEKARVKGLLEKLNLKNKRIKEILPRE
ncbi:MAG: D-aminoacyl-tRNA deacylase [Candidatus Woesearchaeota archaeon]